MELWEFIKVVFDSWVEKVGIILTILPFIEKIPRVEHWLKKQPILERFVPMLWVIGGFCIFWGFYSAWKEQRQERTIAERKLEELTKPDLKLNPEQMISGDSPDMGGLQVFVEFTMKNYGAPSAATAFEIEIKSKTINTGRLRSIFIPDGFTVRNPQGLKLAQFHKDMILDEKTTHAIQRGDLVGGWLRFVLPNIRAEQLQRDAPTVTFYWKDINGKEYSYTETKLPPLKGPMYNPPTGSSPFIFPPESKPKS